MTQQTAGSAPGSGFSTSIMTISSLREAERPFCLGEESQNFGGLEGNKVR